MVQQYPVEKGTITTGSWSSAKNILFLFFISTLHNAHMCYIVKMHPARFNATLNVLLAVYISLKYISIVYLDQSILQLYVNNDNNTDFGRQTKKWLTFSMFVSVNMVCVNIYVANFPLLQLVNTRKQQHLPFLQFSSVN